MNATAVVVAEECPQLTLQIERVPEKLAIKELSTNRADQPFHKQMRNRHMWNRLDISGLKHAQVGEPAMKGKQRVIISADALW